jgi:DivIVA domain-containing protein
MTSPETEGPQRAEQASAEAERRITPADIHAVRFSRASLLHPGYDDGEVDRFRNRLAEEVGRLIAEKSELRDRVRALQEQADGAARVEPPSDQAVRILASAQQTADNYVAEAEDFSRQMTAEARSQYEQQLREARENAGAIMQAAQEAAARMTGGSGAGALDDRPGNAPRLSTEELEEQVAYLKAFAQACRTQLRAYLEALLTDVEQEWGHADPGALPQAPLRTSAERGGGTSAMNVAAEVPLDNSADARRPAPSNGVQIAGVNR